MSCISIHALLAESDNAVFCLCTSGLYFYPRSPCGERLKNPEAVSKYMIFLSTLSLRRATLEVAAMSAPTYCYFYPRSPCGERQRPSGCRSNDFYFYPRSPCGERPGKPSGRWNQRYFYPRSPCGERPVTSAGLAVPRQFLSTLSLRRATFIFSHPLVLILLFLSTLSLRRATPPAPPRARVLKNFYPRSPCGERRQQSSQENQLWQFLSTLSLRRATLLLCCLIRPLLYFYPRSPCGERLYTAQHT